MRWLGRSLLAVVVIAVAVMGAFGYFDRDAVRVYDPPAAGQASGPPPIVAVNFSGDMGLRFLMGASTSRGLTRHGIPVVGIKSPVLFRQHRTRAEVDGLVADAIRTALARTGARRAVVIGQSFGADIVHAGLAHLPADLRPRVAAIILILPGDTVFFRADPTGYAYDGTPDAMAVTSANALVWAPLTCIYGVEETDSLCPLLHVPAATIVAMPGGHNIHHDSDGLLAHVLAAIGRVTPINAAQR